MMIRRVVLHRQPQGLEMRANVGPGSDGLGDLVEVAEEDEVLAVAVVPEVRAVHEMLHGAIGFRAVAEQLERVINMAGDAVGKLVALRGGQVVPAREVGAREFGGELGAGLVGFDRAEQGLVIGDAVGAAQVLERADFFHATGFEFERLEQEFFLRGECAPELVGARAVRRAFEMFLQTERDEEIHGSALGLIHHLPQNRSATLSAFLVQVRNSSSRSTSSMLEKPVTTSAATAWAASR